MLPHTEQGLKLRTSNPTRVLFLVPSTPTASRDSGFSHCSLTILKLFGLPPVQSTHLLCGDQSRSAGERGPIQCTGMDGKRRAIFCTFIRRSALVRLKDEKRAEPGGSDACSGRVEVGRCQ